MPGPAAVPVYRNTGPWSVPNTGYAGGIQPYSRGGVRVGPGWVGKVRVGYQGPPGARRAAPARATPGVSSSPPAAGTFAPTLPTGTYNPERDISTQESERGLGQLEGEIGTARSRDRADYFTQKSELERTGQQHAQDASRAQQLLAQSFQRLAEGQSERANQMGVLQGGAVLQSAAKRAVNEGKEREAQQTSQTRQKEADELALAKLAREGAPPDEANPLGGRAFQDLLTKLTNAQSNAQFYQTSQERLAGQEAAERGYTPPPAPAKAAPARAVSRRPGARGSALMRSRGRRR